MTFRPVRAAKVRGWTNCWAAEVIMTSTVQPRSCRVRASSAALYAAMPPPTASATLIGALLGWDFDDAVASSVLVLHKTAPHFFHRGYRRLLGSARQK